MLEELKEDSSKYKSLVLLRFNLNDLESLKRFGPLDSDIIPLRNSVRRDRIVAEPSFAGVHLFDGISVERLDSNPGAEVFRLSLSVMDLHLDRMISGAKSRKIPDHRKS